MKASQIDGNKVYVNKLSGFTQSELISSKPVPTIVARAYFCNYNPGFMKTYFDPLEVLNGRVGLALDIEFGTGKATIVLGEQSDITDFLFNSGGLTNLKGCQGKKAIGYYNGDACIGIKLD